MRGVESRLSASGEPQIKNKAMASEFQTFIMKERERFQKVTHDYEIRDTYR